MNVKKTPLSALRLNDGNPRVIKDHKFQKLVKSILTFPEMLSLREIVARWEKLTGNKATKIERQ